MQLQRKPVKEKKLHSRTVKKKRLGLGVTDEESAHPFEDEGFEQVQMHNYHDFSYSGPIYIGSQGQKMEVVYDTGSDWLTIESSDCQNCGGDMYKYEDS